MFKFFDLLRAHYRFDQERFICALGVRFSFDKLRKLINSLFKFFFFFLTVELVYTRRTSHWTRFRHILYGS